MRDYDIVYDSIRGSYLIIFKDQEDTGWSIKDRDLTKETAVMALKGYKS